MESVARVAFYPLVLVAAVGATAALLRGGWSPPLVVAAVNVVTSVTIAVAERKLPYRAAWNRSHGDVRTDLLHMVFGMIPVPILFRASALAALTAASAWIAARVGGQLWPSELPIAAHLLLALIVAELGQYWVHRLAHERALLWRLHSVHHTVERLYWLNAGRFHPFDTLLQHASEITPLVLLGVDADVLALYTVFTSANGLLRHANVDMRTRALSWFFSTADLHRFHHSVAIEESNANYGANLIVWDLVFGTRRVPKAAAPAPARLGLGREFPRTFLGQLAMPFRSRP